MEKVLCGLSPMEVSKWFFVLIQQLQLFPEQLILFSEFFDDFFIVGPLLLEIRRRDYSDLNRFHSTLGFFFIIMLE